MSESVKHQSSSSFDRRKLVLWGAIVVAIAGGFYFSDTRDKDIKEDATNRSIDINQFLRQQCARDDFRDQIIIGALEDAKRRSGDKGQRG